MKNKFLVAITFIMLIAVISIIPSYAVEAETTTASITSAYETVSETEETEETEETAPETVEDTALVVPDNTEIPDISGEEHTFFSRIDEYLETYKTEVIGFLGDIAIFVSAIIVYFKNKKKTNIITSDLFATKTDASKILGSQGGVVESVNEMIDAFNNLSEEYKKLRKSYEDYGTVDGERNRVVGAVVAQNAAILEILTTVYVNSKNLPQGVKDLVNLKYANCLKSLEDDCQLKSIVEAVRTNIGTNKTVEEETPEDTEV